MKKIGVVIPVYNGGKTIEKSIKSLLNQTYNDWLAIIINDGSTDNTKEVLDKYKDDSRFYIDHFNRNKGRPYARQEGLEVVRKLNLKYMCMLDADDWYYPDKLESQFQFMETHSDLALLSSAIGVTNKLSKLIRIFKPFSKLRFLRFEKYSEFVMIPHASSIIRVEIIPENLKYNIKLDFSEDQDFLRRLLLKKIYAFSPEVNYIYNRENSFSINKFKGSMKASIISYNNLPMSRFLKISHFIKCNFKAFMVVILFKLNLKDKYFNRVGQLPTNREIDKYLKI